jgi:two-component system OmpR family sensor kinase
VTSIRSRLLAWLLGGVTAALAAGGVSTYFLAREEANALADYQLQQTALSLRDHAVAAERAARQEDPDDAMEILVQIWGREGARLYRSNPRSAMPGNARIGYADVEAPDGRYRVFAIQAGEQVIQVAQPLWVRERLAAQLALRTLWPFALLLPLLAALVWTTVGRGLAPLERVAREVRRRSHTSLEPLREGGLPDEVRPLAHALNDLLQRLGQTLEAQRTFVADAAHELRTPLAALALQSQLLERAPDAAERRAALANLREGIERASRLVQQLLALARAEEAVDAAPEAARVDDVAREAIRQLTAVAQAKGVDLGLVRSESVRARCGAPALATLVANLIDNAVRYTPASGQVNVSAYGEGDAALILVEDSGPGIPAQDRDRVFDRFYRQPGAGGDGSGLGLAIARRIAERAGGSIALEDAAIGGLRVRVRLPRAAG